MTQSRLPAPPLRPPEVYPHGTPVDPHHERPAQGHPAGKEILRGIWLSFYYDARIGVLGANGAGKSTLLRIMAGEDSDFGGEAFLAEGMTVGFLPQEPKLPAGATVLECVEEAVAPTRALLTRFDELSMRLGEEMPPEEMERVLEEQGKLQDAIEAAGAWELDSRLELAMETLRLPPPEAPGLLTAVRTPWR